MTFKVSLDYIPKAGLNWVGNTNELNAGIEAENWHQLLTNLD